MDSPPITSPMMRLLLSPAGDTAGGPLPDNQGQTPPTPQPAPPPAAEQVKNSDVKESDAGEIVALRRQLADEKAGRKKDQTRLSELEDENRTLKTPPAKPAEAQKKHFLDGCTFLD